MAGRQILLIFVFAFLIAGLLVTCQANATPTLAEFSGPGIGVGISDDTCPLVTVQVGQQISWTNQDKQEHIVRAKSVERERICIRDLTAGR
jgi:hypothetical protein